MVSGASAHSERRFVFEIEKSKLNIMFHSDSEPTIEKVKGGFIVRIADNKPVSPIIRFGTPDNPILPEDGGYLCLDGDFKDDFVKAIETITTPTNAGNTTIDSPKTHEDCPGCPSCLKCVHYIIKCPAESIWLGLCPSYEPKD